MKRFIIWIVHCMAILMALGSLRSTHDYTKEVNYHDSYLGAIPYNEYGVSNNDKDEHFKQNVITVYTPILFALFCLEILFTSVPKLFLFCYVKILKQRDKLLPRLYHSNCFISLL